MGTKEVFAKGIYLYEGIESIDLSKLKNFDFLVARIGEGYDPVLSKVIDKKFHYFQAIAKAAGVPLFAWMRVYPRMYQDTSWDMDHFEKWPIRKNSIDSNEDFALAVVDRMLADRPWWHGLIYSVYMGSYETASKSYTTGVTPGWATATTRRIRELMQIYYQSMTPGDPTSPTRFIWPEFATGIIDNREWDPQLTIDTYIKPVDLSVWMSANFPATTVDVLDLNALPWPSVDIPTYSKESRGNCLWRAANTTIKWSGAKDANGNAMPVGVYLMYNTPDSLYARFKMSQTAAPSSGSGTGSDSGNGTSSGTTGGGSGTTGSNDLTALIPYLERIAKAQEDQAAALIKIAGKEYK